MTYIRIEFVSVTVWVIVLLVFLCLLVFWALGLCFCSVVVFVAKEHTDTKPKRKGVVEKKEVQDTQSKRKKEREEKREFQRREESKREEDGSVFGKRGKGGREEGGGVRLV